MINFKDLFTPPLTLKEFKTILGRYDINERDRDRLSAWFEKSNRTLDTASKIGNIDFTLFMEDGVIHEGGHNTIDYFELSNFKSINDRVASTPSMIVNKKEHFRKALKDILTAYYINMFAYIEMRQGTEISNNISSDISYIATFFYSESNNEYISYLANMTLDTNINRTLKSFCNFDLFSNRNRAITPYASGVDVNALFYLTKDAPIGGTPAGRLMGNSGYNMISNYLIHAHICFDENTIYSLESYIIEGEIPDEIIDNVKFLSYVEVSNLTKYTQNIITLRVSDNKLLPEQITAINEHNAVFTNPNTGGTIIPWGYENIDTNVHEITSAKIYLPSDCGYKQVTITNNKITEIIEA